MTLPALARELLVTQPDPPRRVALAAVARRLPLRGAVEFVAIQTAVGAALITALVFADEFTLALVVGAVIIVVPYAFAALIVRVLVGPWRDTLTNGVRVPATVATATLRHPEIGSDRAARANRREETHGTCEVTTFGVSRTLHFVADSKLVSGLDVGNGVEVLAAPYGSRAIALELQRDGRTSEREPAPARAFAVRPLGVRIRNGCGWLILGFAVHITATELAYAGVHGTAVVAWAAIPATLFALFRSSRIALAVDDAGVRARNQWRTLAIPWNEIRVVGWRRSRVWNLAGVAFERSDGRIIRAQATAGRSRDKDEQLLADLRPFADARELPFQVGLDDLEEHG